MNQNKHRPTKVQIKLKTSSIVFLFVCVICFSICLCFDSFQVLEVQNIYRRTIHTELLFHLFQNNPRFMREIRLRQDI